MVKCLQILFYFFYFAQNVFLLENRFFFLLLQNYSSIDSDQLPATRTRSSGQIINNLFFSCAHKIAVFFLVVVITIWPTFCWSCYAWEINKNKSSRYRINQTFKSILRPIERPLEIQLSSSNRICFQHSFN